MVVPSGIGSWADFQYFFTGAKYGLYILGWSFPNVFMCLKLLIDVSWHSDVNASVCVVPTNVFTILEMLLDVSWLGVDNISVYLVPVKNDSTIQ